MTHPLSKQKTSRKQQEIVQKEKKVDSKNIEKISQRLDELKKKGKYVDVGNLKLRDFNKVSNWLKSSSLQ